MASTSTLPGRPLRVGLIGVGNISPAYISGCRQYEILDLVACADVDQDKAKRVATENNIPRCYSVDDLLADPEIDIVINLTIPAVHAAVSLQVIAAGKHVYSEKPLATTLEDGAAVLEAAKARGARVGCAPDTFLFGQHQTCRQAVDQGLAGKIAAATGFFANHGPEKWHPNPDFFYQPGAGPMLDMGPYYVTCLVNLLGPVARVSGTTTNATLQRIKESRAIPVKVPTHYTGVLEFASGAVATLLVSFDVWAHHLPRGMELYGDSGSLTVPDPNGYEPSTVTSFQEKTGEWAEVANTFPKEWKRGIGVADMAYAIYENRPHRASGELAYHALEVMFAFEAAYRSGRYVDIQSTVARPEALVPDFASLRV